MAFAGKKTNLPNKKKTFDKVTKTLRQKEFKRATKLISNYSEITQLDLKSIIKQYLNYLFENGILLNDRCALIYFENIIHDIHLSETSYMNYTLSYLSEVLHADAKQIL
jgi:hypothetical protein